MQAEGSSNATQKRQSKSLICLVPNCTVDVASGPNYLRRHKLCQYHLRAKSVEIEGQTVRFCQQCGRFQPVSDFKDDQRSCEAALQAHNARRRVKKDGNSPKGQEDRKNNKRTLASGVEDPSSSDEGGLGAARKQGPRKHNSQRSAQSHLQQSGGASGDSLKVFASDDGDRPQSDATRSVKCTSNNSPTPNNSSGSSEGVGNHQQQHYQQHYQQQDVSSILTANSMEAAMAGPDRLQSQLQHLSMLQPSLPGSSFGTQEMHQANFLTEGTQAVFSDAVALQPGALSMPLQANGLLPSHHHLARDELAQIGAFNASQVHDGSGAKATQESLASWIIPREIMQKQEVQLARFCSSTSSGLLQEAGHNLLRRHAQPEQNLGVLQRKQQQHMPAQVTGYQQHQQQQQQPFFGGRPGSWNSSRCSRVGSSGTDAASHSTIHTTAVGMAPAVSAAACTDAAALTTQVMPAVALPASSTGAALHSEPPVSAAACQTQGFDSSSAMGLLCAAKATVSKPQASVLPEASAMDILDMDAEALLDQALDVLLSVRPNFQSNEVLTQQLGQQGQQQWSNVGTNSGIATHANTSSPSSSNLYGGNGSGPLSVPSLPSAAVWGQPGTAALLSAQAQAPHGLATTSTGPLCATDLQHADSPSHAPAGLRAGAPHSSMLAAGGRASMGDAVVDVISTGFVTTGAPASCLPICMPGVGFSSIPASCGTVAAIGPQLAHAPSLNTGTPGMMHTQHTGTAMAGVCGPVAVAGFGGHGTDRPSLPGIMTQAPAAALQAPHLAAGLSNAPDVCGAVAPAGSKPSMGSTCGGIHDSNTLTLPGWWQQQQQQHHESRLLQQQLLLQQQQQEAEASLQQQQQLLQRQQQLLQLQEGLNVRMTHTQQLVRLSIKLHGITPDQLPSSTVLAMERLLLNNPADIETILLQPSIRHGCIQLELDILVKCPIPGQLPMDTRAPHADLTSHMTTAPDDSTAILDDFSSESLDAPKVQLLSSNSSNTEAVIDALSGAAAQAAMARVCQALPFAWLVDGILDLPLLHQGAATAADAASDGGGSSTTVRSCVTSIYAQVGKFLGVWRAGSGVVQDWKSDLPDFFTGPCDDTLRPAGYTSTTYQGLGNNSSCWQPRIQSCAPLVTALAESSAENSPTAAAGAEAIHAVHPVPLRLQLEVAVPSNAVGPVELWCTQQGSFLPLAMQAEVRDLWVDDRGITRELLCLEVVAGLPASAPGLLLLQAEQRYAMRSEDDTHSSSSTWHAGQTDAAAEHSEQAVLRAAEDELSYMSGVVPVLICPSAAMAAEMTAHLLVAQNHAEVAQKLMHLGLLLDFWAMHQQQQEDGRAGAADGDVTLAPLKAWRRSLLQQRSYLKALKVMGTQLLLLAMTCGMSATASHLHSIMSTLRSLEVATRAVASTANLSAATAATAQSAATAVAAAALPAAVDAGSSGAGEGMTDVKNSDSCETVQGARPVQEWVFEEVDCKAVNAGKDSCHGAGEAGGSSSSSKQEVKGGTSSGHSITVGRVAPTAAGAAPGQQAPLMILYGSAQMLALLILMYLLLDIVAATYRGQSPTKQLLASLLHLKELMSIMLVPLAMMCFGGLLAIWQFGTCGVFDSIAQAVQQGQGQACHAVGGATNQTGSGKQVPEQGTTATATA